MANRVQGESSSSSLFEPNASVVVIGSGLAGLTAAITAAENRPRVQVTLLEKNLKLGGNSAKATSGINALNLGDGDSPLRFQRDTKEAGHHSGKDRLISILTEQSTSALSFLHEKLSESIPANTPELSNTIRGGGHSVARTWRFPPTSDGRPIPVGYTLISAMEKAANRIPNIRILKGVHVTKILTDSQNKAIEGVVFKEGKSEYNLSAGSVVLATGGFAASRQMLSTYAPSLSHLPTTNGPWATGDGVEIAIAAGCQTTDMAHVQVHPTGFINPKAPNSASVFLAPEALRACGALLVDPASGKRFVNELLPRDELSESIFQHGMPITQWERFAGVTNRTSDQIPEKDDNAKQATVAGIILSPVAAEAFGISALKFYEKMGILKECENLRKAAEILHVPVETLRRDLRQYVEDAKGGVGRFGKKYMPNAGSYADDGKYWVGWITPTLHYCMGGVNFTEEGQLVNGEGHPIKGLYAAGEVTGGVHGKNRLVGNSLLECVVFGRISGEN
eukprot:CAMPEP_0114487064 /NCGR_PEP_ID=MMETSP0109-20121206/560_1 /TAXON_ID=29199 /ORGANISM="Chlorarachnion reptans, Strain CCCM449" /LENGTH=506 /DNA_ID=CAMNT_0001663291 /DNA_START=82 /DNA_END=1599 /DNA_ORIENTATION=-